MRDPHVRRLPVRSCTVLAGDGTATSHTFVFCPVREHAEPTATCARCPRLLSESSRQVVCEVPALDERHADAAELAARTPVGEIMRRDAIAVRGEVALETVASLLGEGGHGCAVVVDETRRVVGLVSKTDLIRERDPSVELVPNAPRELGRGFHVETLGAVTAGDVMTPGAQTLPEDARLSHAIGLMAGEHLAHVPVVNGGGALVGVLEADDVLAWIAARIGYATLS